MIQLKNFSVDNLYKKIDLSISKGEVVCITGENGTGKSMLANFLMGIYNRYTGDIIIDNKVMDDNNYKELRKKIKLIKQDVNFQLIGYTVEDEIKYKLEQNNIEENKINEIIEKQFYNFDLSAPLHTLNSQKTKELLILSSLSLNEDVLIIDETLSNVSHEFKKEMFNYLKDNNKTVIVITNNIDDTYYSDRSFILYDKKLIEIEKEDSLPLIKYKENENHVVMTYKDYKFNEGLNVVTGESGSGKSTLLNELVGYKKTKEEIRHNFKYIGFVSQNPVLQITKNTVYDLVSNIEIGENSIIDIFRTLDIDTKLLKKDPFTLSTGQLIQVLIVQSLLRGQECMILDECLENIDPNKRSKILDYIINNVKCVIVTTHNQSIYNNYDYCLIDVGDSNE